MYYLVLRRIPTHPMKRVQELLPYRWQAHRQVVFLRQKACVGKRISGRGQRRFLAVGQVRRCTPRSRYQDESWKQRDPNEASGYDAPDQAIR